MTNLNGEFDNKYKGCVDLAEQIFLTSFCHCSMENFIIYRSEE